LKDLQAVILAAVLLTPVAQGAGEKGVVSAPSEHCSVAHALMERLLVRLAPPLQPVWKKNKAARKLLTLVVESLKWP
jgi:hypothetical protein